jgi:hypothetical protein
MKKIYVTSDTSDNLFINNKISTVLSTDSLYIENDIVDFIELVLAALGHDIKYEDYKKMSKNEKNQLLRDLKIKSIL